MFCQKNYIRYSIFSASGLVLLERLMHLINSKSSKFVRISNKYKKHFERHNAHFHFILLYFCRFSIGYIAVSILQYWPTKVSNLLHWDKRAFQILSKNLRRLKYLLSFYNRVINYGTLGSILGHEIVHGLVGLG